MDHFKDKFRLRIVIALKNLDANIAMLYLIHSHFGGALCISKKYVTLTFQSKKDIDTLLKIFKKYPLLTSRKICQLQFALKCLNEEIDQKKFIQERNNKYFNQLEVLESLKFQYFNSLPPHFPCWLSGFIEAEGHSKLRRSKKGGIESCQLQIGQTYDYFILQKIKRYFYSTHQITKDKNKQKDHFRVAIGGPIARNLIYKHFENYPLLGQKAVSYSKWLF